MSSKPFVGQPGIPEALQRVFDTGEGFGFLAPELRAVVTSLDLTDHQYLKVQGVNSFAAGGFTAAVVGQPSGFVVVNPATSQKLLRIRQLVVSFTPANNTIWWGTYGGGIAPALANGVNLVPTPRDSRITNTAGGTGVATGKPQSASSLGWPGVGMQAVIFLNMPPLVIPVDMTVSPGGAFFAHGVVANQGFNAAIAWDERQTTSPELNMPG